MAENATTAHGHPADISKPDFLNLVTGSAGAIAGTSVDSINPSAGVLARSAADVNPQPIPAGSGVTVLRQGKPIVVRHGRSQKAAEDIQLASPIAPRPDADRGKPGHAEWIALVGIGTHLGCVPLRTMATDPRGDWGGWFFPCHGSQYDTSGRLRHGPAPANLAVPPYKFDDNTKLTIG